MRIELVFSGILPVKTVLSSPDS